MQIPRQRRKPLSMDLSPLIDCVFQLLIFFMLSSTFLTPTIGLSLPQASSNVPPEAVEIIVTIGPSGELFLNHRPVALANLTEELRPLVAKSSKKVVTFRGDKGVRYELFVDALDAAKASGAETFDIAHETPGEKP